MNLKQYLKREERSVPWLAKKLGCHYQTLHNIIKGRAMARPSLIDKIVKFTDGEVTIDPPIGRFCPHCEQPLKRWVRNAPQKDTEVKKDIVEN